MNEELYHYGVPGMKKGVRRYQNEDGTLTELGKSRAFDRSRYQDPSGRFSGPSSRYRHTSGSSNNKTNPLAAFGDRASNSLSSIKPTSRVVSTVRGNVSRFTKPDRYHRNPSITSGFGNNLSNFGSNISTAAGAYAGTSKARKYLDLSKSSNKAKDLRKNYNGVNLRKINAPSVGSKAMGAVSGGINSVTDAINSKKKKIGSLVSYKNIPTFGGNKKPVNVGGPASKVSNATAAVSGYANAQKNLYNASNAFSKDNKKKRRS